MGRKRETQLVSLESDKENQLMMTFLYFTLGENRTK
ncbi:unnamed protein product, partial [Rotaria sp. Silwood1]